MLLGDTLEKRVCGGDRPVTSKTPTNTEGAGGGILHFIQESLPNFNLANCNTEDLSAISCAQLCLDIIRKLTTLGVVENSESTKSGVSFLGREMGHRMFSLM